MKCKKCGSKKVPLHTSGYCGNCATPEQRNNFGEKCPHSDMTHSGYCCLCGEWVEVLEGVKL